MKRTLPLIVLLTATALVSSCGKKEGSDGEGGKTVTVTLTDLDNLKIDLSETTVPSKMGSSVMIVNINESLAIAVAKDSPANIAEAKKQATEMYKATNIKEISMDGGWAITFENEGSMGKSYWLTLRREVGRKQYSCTTSVGYKALRDGALRACKTLRN